MSTLPAVRTIDAQALLAQAIDKGTDVDTLERLVALGKDMLELQARQAFAEAMATPEMAGAQGGDPLCISTVSTVQNTSTCFTSTTVW